MVRRRPATTRPAPAATATAAPPAAHGVTGLTPVAARLLPVLVLLVVSLPVDVTAVPEGVPEPVVPWSPAGLVSTAGVTFLPPPSAALPPAPFSFAALSLAALSLAAFSFAALSSSAFFAAASSLARASYWPTSRKC